MTDTIQYITDIMPYNSGFKDSDLYKVMDETIGEYFDNLLNNRVDEVYNSFFITLAEGVHLDRLGRLYGVRRGDAETDDDYRNRIRFQADKMINLDNLTELGCEVYAYSDDYNLESTLLSGNITEANKILIVTPNNHIKKLLEDNIFLKSVVIV